MWPSERTMLTSYVPFLLHFTYLLIIYVPVLLSYLFNILYNIPLHLSLPLLDVTLSGILELLASLLHHPLLSLSFPPHI